MGRGRGRGANSERTYESLRIAARIVLHYYMRGGWRRCEEVTVGEGKEQWRRIHKIDQVAS